MHPRASKQLPANSIAIKGSQLLSTIHSGVRHSTWVLLEDSLPTIESPHLYSRPPRFILSGNTTSLSHYRFLVPTRRNYEGSSPMLTTTLLSLALAAIVLLVKRVKTHLSFPLFLALLHRWTGRHLSLLAASTTFVRSFVVPHGHWISLAPVIPVFSTLTAIIISHGLILVWLSQHLSPSMRWISQGKTNASLFLWAPAIWSTFSLQSTLGHDLVSLLNANNSSSPQYPTEHPPAGLTTLL